MRIVYLVHQYPPAHVGGTETYTHGLARRARAAGHEVRVITYDECPTPEPSDFVPRRREHEGIPVLEIPYNLSVSPVVSRFEHDNPFVAARVREALEDWTPDLVHVTHAMKLGVGAMDACRELGIPMVVSLCDYWFICPRHTLLTWDGRVCDGPSDWRECFRCIRDLHGVARRDTERQAVRERPDRTRAAVEAAGRVFALSPFLKQRFVANGYDAARIEVLPHGLETQGLSPPGPRREGPTRFAFVGALQPFKGAHVVAEALSRDRTFPAELVLHGAGGPPDYERRLRELAARDRRVSLAGRFQPAEFSRVLGDADYVVVPALWYENEPIVVKAAKHLGIPLIVSRIGSLVDMVEPGVEGWTVPPGDVPAWTEALALAVAERDRWPRAPRPQPDMAEHYAALETAYRELVPAASRGDA